MDLKQIKQLLPNDLAAVDAYICEQLNAELRLIKELGKHIVGSGGKRLRPLLVLLVARGCDYQGDDHVKLAALVEFIHTATLLHDDVVDASDMRRGNETANAIWGNEASVLVGDFLFSRAFQMMVDIKNIPVMSVLASTTNAITRGEINQLMNRHNDEPDEQAYMEIIEAKTATLFAAAARVGAIISDQDQQLEQAMHDYGNNLGIAFQLIDDALDYSGDVTELGKNIGDDLAEGKPTLPIIHALQNGSPEQQQLIRDTLKQGKRENINAVQQAITDTNAIAYTYQRAQHYAELAISSLECLAPSAYRDALMQLPEFAIDRQS